MLYREPLQRGKQKQTHGLKLTCATTIGLYLLCFRCCLAVFASVMWSEWSVLVASKGLMLVCYWYALVLHLYRYLRF